jgi:hypothetical protein
LVELISSLYPEFFHEHFNELSELLDNKEVLDRVLVIIAHIGQEFKISASAAKSMVTLSLVLLILMFAFVSPRCYEKVVCLVV